MKKDKAMTEIGQQYATAHGAHYGEKNLGQALELYRAILVDHPNTPEAGYSHSQIQNIAKSLVPKQDLVDAQIDLAIAHLESEAAAVAEPGPAAPIL